ncbi:MAG: tRNA (guanosine(46)-N7)-methyltransferase TrmB [bacterium]|nr:tRNA (guanosine(46)-N7)-methyltransferase TrmB [Candidatus Sumerlaeota bacterium]
MAVHVFVDAGYLTLADVEAPMDLAVLFGRSGAVEVEVGTGRGDFLVGCAAANPSVNYIGIERKTGVLNRAVRKSKRAGLENVALINSEAENLLANYLPDRCLRAVHVYFSDPWPKRRHARRRFFRAGAPDMLARILRCGGFVHARTDVKEYQEEMLEVFARNPLFRRIDPPPELLAFQTGYERRFTSAGLTIFRASYEFTGKTNICA